MDSTHDLIQTLLLDVVVVKDPYPVSASKLSFELQRQVQNS
jgi:hypothetical protein